MIGGRRLKSSSVNRQSSTGISDVEGDKCRRSSRRVPEQGVGIVCISIKDESGSTKKIHDHAPFGRCQELLPGRNDFLGMRRRGQLDHFLGRLGRGLWGRGDGNHRFFHGRQCGRLLWETLFPSAESAKIDEYVGQQVADVPELSSLEKEDRVFERHRHDGMGQEGF